MGIDPDGLSLALVQDGTAYDFNRASRFIHAF
jgi:hypothetical protein